MNIKYLSDALEARRNQMDAEAVRWAKQDAKQAKFQIAADLHPAIGATMTSKGAKYYAFINGEYTEGSIEALTAKLI